MRGQPKRSRKIPSIDKENIHRAISSGDLYDGLDLEATHHVHCGQTKDHRNAAKAFVEKREPVFQGR